MAMSRANEEDIHNFEQAIIGNNALVVEAFLSLGIDCDTEFSNGYTPLMTAASYGHSIMIDLLVAAGASVSRKNCQGLSAIDVAPSYVIKNILRRAAAAENANMIILALHEKLKALQELTTAVDIFQALETCQDLEIAYIDMCKKSGKSHSFEFISFKENKLQYLNKLSETFSDIYRVLSAKVKTLSSERITIGDLSVIGKMLETIKTSSSNDLAIISSSLGILNVIEGTAQTTPHADVKTLYAEILNMCNGPTFLSLSDNSDNVNSHIPVMSSELTVASLPSEGESTFSSSNNRFFASAPNSTGCMPSYMQVSNNSTSTINSASSRSTDNSNSRTSKQQLKVFEDAVKRADLELIYEYLTANDKCHTADLDFSLVLATRYGHLDVVNALLHSGVGHKNINTALWHALSAGYVDIAESLVNSGADVNQINTNGYSALMHIALNVYVEPEAYSMLMVKRTVADRYQRRATNIINVSSLVDALLLNGADVNNGDRHGNTALMLAAKSGNDAVLRKLVAAGADVNKQNENGETAAMIAISNGHNKIAKVLLSHPQADFYLKDFAGYSVFTHARTQNWVLSTRSTVTSAAEFTFFKRTSKKASPVLLTKIQSCDVQASIVTNKRNS